MCDFGTMLKRLREENSVSQQTLADIIGVERAAISRYETKNRQPSFELLNKIADYFGVSADYLLGRTNIKTCINSHFRSDFDNDQKQLMNIYNSLDDFTKGALLERAKVFKEISVVRKQK